MLNGFVESFNGRLRDECFNEPLFANLKDAREIIEATLFARIRASKGSRQPSSQHARSGGKTGTDSPYKRGQVREQVRRVKNHARGSLPHGIEGFRKRTPGET